MHLYVQMSVDRLALVREGEKLLTGRPFRGTAGSPRDADDRGLVWPRVTLDVSQEPPILTKASACRWTLQCGDAPCRNRKQAASWVGQAAWWERRSQDVRCRCTALIAPSGSLY